MSRSRFSRLRVAAVGMLLIGPVALCGCRLLGSDKITGTMGYQQQMAEITQIAPYGTLREETVARVEKAGVIGEYSRAGKSIYYCYLWNRSDGKRWHMTVSLLFNAKGEFYAINLADADIQQEPAGPATATPLPGKTRLPSRRTPSAASSPVPWPQEAEHAGPAFPEPATTDPRGGRRTPFEDGQR
jgi:hypothetical protein